MPLSVLPSQPLPTEPLLEKGQGLEERSGGPLRGPGPDRGPGFLPRTGAVNWRGWVVVLASFLCVAIVDGVGYTTGLMLEALRAELGGSRSAVAVVGSLQVFMYSLSSPVVAKLIDSFGPRAVCISGAVIASLGLLAASFAPSLALVYCTYGLVTGFGFGLMYLPSVVGVAPYFLDNRALAIGISLCGSGVGTFSLAPLSSYVLHRHGWRWVVRTLSGLCLLCTACGALMAPALTGAPGMVVATGDREERRRQVEERNEGPPARRILVFALGRELADTNRLATFLLVVLADFIAFMAIYIPYTYLPPLAIADGILPGDAAFIISVGGISNTLGRLLGGWLSDKRWAPKALHLALVAILAAAIPSFILPHCIAYWTYLVNFGFFGVVTGCLVGCTSPVLLDILGLAALSPAFGMITAFRGLACLLGPPLAGVLLDSFDVRGLALTLTGALLLASSLTQVLAAVTNYCHKKRNGYTRII
jgi:MFS family permease